MTYSRLCFDFILALSCMGSSKPDELSIQPGSLAVELPIHVTQAALEIIIRHKPGRNLKTNDLQQLDVTEQLLIWPLNIHLNQTIKRSL